MQAHWLISPRLAACPAIKAIRALIVAVDGVNDARQSYFLQPLILGIFMKPLLASLPLMAAALFLVACLPTAPEAAMVDEPSAYMLHLNEIGPPRSI